MSKFLNALMYVTGDKRKVSEFGTPVNTKWEFVQPHAGAYTALGEVIFTAEFKRVAFCQEKDVPKVLRDIRHELREYIYGEFRLLLLDLDIAIHEHDQRRAAEIAQKLLLLVNGE